MPSINIPRDEDLLRQYHDMLQREQMEKQMALGWPKPPVPPAPPVFQGSVGSLGAGMSTPELYSSSKLCEMLAMRMRWVRGVALPMNFLEAHLSDKIVYVFMVHNGQPAVLEDDWALFPSDALVTKLRLLLG